MPYPAHDTSIYHVEVDPSRDNDAHAYMLRLVGCNKRVLELGCTSGHMTRALVQQGCSVVGVELDAAAAALAREAADEVIVGDLDQPATLEALAPRRFDVIVAGDVLEHLREPLAPLRAARGLLDPGGELVVSIPNVAHADVRLRLLDGDFPYHPFGLLDTTHLRFFSWETLKALLHTAGFVPLQTMRVIVPMFASELGVDRNRVDPQVLDAILQDPEAETYQFVVRAVLDDGNGAVRAAASRLEQLEAEVRHLVIDRALLRQRMAGVEAQLEEAAYRAEAAEREVAAYRNTRLFRHTYQARQLYGRLRGVNQRL